MRTSGGLLAGLSALWRRKPVSAYQPDEEAQELIDNATAFERVRLEDIMVPRADIVAVSEGATLGDLARKFISSSHSRLPVYHETLDDPRGMVHIKDVLQFLLSGPGQTVDLNIRILDQIVRPVLFVPPSAHADDLMLKMQSTHIHMALVVDEYGGTDGLVTLEDLVEQIVGKIEDEHDSAAPVLKTLAPGKWEADARVPIEELEALSGLDLGNGADEDEVDTLGGLAFQLAGRVPQRGEILLHPAGLEFEVKDADPRRIHCLLIRARNQRHGG